MPGIICLLTSKHRKYIDMKRIKIIFSIVLLVLAIPMWRYMDFLTWIWASETLYALAFFFWGLTYLVLPAWLLKPKLLPTIAFALVFIGTILSYNLGPLSKMATNDSSHSHCGPMSFTGMFYPTINFMTQAPADDLDARNQLCWIKKMIQRIPEKFSTKHELEDFIKLTQTKLLNPENKYRVSLPLIALLYAIVLAHEEGVMPNISNGKMFIDSLKFWIDQYTDEISSRQYSWWDYPYGPYIQFEYGLVEKNWESIVNSLILEEK
ncbi:MAG TPA: hypothetical protein VNJ08_05260 [Bacteriovoracaceae bacterium]|nr:hypothetical protein [Bacteriovoracaceae bacterium]